MTHHLPEQLTSFIGRDAELLDIEELVRQRRLVTLTGAGGCGKTRLAIELGGRLREPWPDAIWFVDLGSVTDPTLVPSVVSSALGVSLDPGGDQVQALAAKLQGRQMLLCLDTCEHLLEITATLADTVLRRCPAVSVLATSREPLGVEGETVWRVPPLRPDEAILMFADRAGLVSPRFDLDSVRDDVRAVCEQVDHIPLAIELAAAWVRALSPKQIATGLVESFRLLAGGPRNGVDRHQTLLASMDWSHALLADDERRFFRRLAVFSGTFTIEAAWAVACEVPGGLEPGALQLIGRLFDKSLITARDVQGEIRYRLLDTVRQYAGEQLVAAGEGDAVRDRHLDHFLTLVEDSEGVLDRDQDTGRRILQSHGANIDAALRWGLSPPAERGDRGRRLAAAMAMQWLIRGQATEGLDLLDRAISLQPADESPVQARLLAGTAMLGMISGRMDLVTESAGRGARIAVRTGEHRTAARCLAASALPHFFVDAERCQAVAAEARLAGETADDPFARDWATVVEGYALQTRNLNQDALGLGRLAFERSSPRGDRFCAAFARGIEIFPAMFGGDVRAAVAIGREVMDIARPLGDYFAVGTNTCNAALALAMAGNLDEARSLLEPIVRVIDSTSDVDVVGFMVPYGLVHLWAGDLDGAVAWFEQGVRRMTEDSLDWTAARCLPGLVGALRRLGRVEEATDWATRAVDVEQSFGAMHELAGILDEQARLICRTDPARARDFFGRSLAVRREYGLRTFYADSLDGLATLTAGPGDSIEAVRLLAISDAARARMGYPRPHVDQQRHDALVASLRADVGEHRFTALSQDGATADLETTVSALTRGRGPRNRPSTGWHALTPTEIDVARLVTRGHSNPEIATRLYMSRSTVKAHLAHIFAKVSVSNRTELATLANRELGQD